MCSVSAKFYTDQKFIYRFIKIYNVRTFVIFIMFFQWNWLIAEMIWLQSKNKLFVIQFRAVWHFSFVYEWDHINLS